MHQRPAPAGLALSAFFGFSQHSWHSSDFLGTLGILRIPGFEPALIYFFIFLCFSVFFFIFLRISIFSVFLYIFEKFIFFYISLFLFSIFSHIFLYLSLCFYMFLFFLDFYVFLNFLSFFLIFLCFSIFMRAPANGTWQNPLSTLWVGAEAGIEPALPPARCTSAQRQLAWRPH